MQAGLVTEKAAATAEVSRGSGTAVAAAAEQVTSCSEGKTASWLPAEATAGSSTTARAGKRATEAERRQGGGALRLENEKRLQRVREGKL